MRLNVLAVVVGAAVGAVVVLAVITGRDIWVTEMMHGSGQR